MRDYRIYRLDKNGHVLGPPVVVASDDDDSVIEEAKKYVDGVAVEVWDEARRVIVLPSEE